MIQTIELLNLLIYCLQT